MQEVLSYRFSARIADGKATGLEKFKLYVIFIVGVI